MVLNDPIDFVFRKALTSIERDFAEILPLFLSTFTHDGSKMKVRRQILTEREGRSLVNFALLVLFLSSSSINTEANMLTLLWSLVKGENKNLPDHFLVMLFD